MTSLPVATQHIFRTRKDRPILSSSAFDVTIFLERVKIATKPTEEIRKDYHPVTGANPADLIAPSHQHPRDLIRCILDPCAMQTQRTFSDRSRTQHSIDFCESFSLIIYQLGWLCKSQEKCSSNRRIYYPAYVASKSW